MANSVTLSYDLNGGSGGPQDIRVPSGVYFQVGYEIPTKPDLVFSGWKIEGYTTTKYPGQQISISSNTTLVAQWTDPTGYAPYQVTFDLNGGSGSVESKSIYRLLPYLFPLTIPTKTGSFFVGWSTSSSTTGSIEPGTWTYEFGSRTYYASYFTDRNPRTLTYNPNGGAGGPGVKNFHHQEYVLTETEVPTRDGFTFVCWNNEADGSGWGYLPGSPIWMLGDIELFAIWIEDRPIPPTPTRTDMLAYGSGGNLIYNNTSGALVYS